MDYQKVHDMFCNFNQKYFWGKLGQVKLNWSKNMTLCAGKTYCRERRGVFSCSIYLSEALLSQRPADDTVNTLLVFHNFHKEVDKFRVHVYRCDGPCTKKRPYFGVLRRAITRPPGPMDKWWAKHSQECGGTFHKVEGPDVSPNTSQTTPKPARASPAFSAGTPSPKYTPSPRPMISPAARSSGATARGTTSDTTKFIASGVRKRIAFSQEKKTDDSTFGEDQVVQKIKERHAHTKSSILLSKEETRMIWRGPSPERGTLVEGRVNYNYRMKSGFKFNIHKYLERYRAVKNAETRLSQKNRVSQRPHASHDAHKLARLQSPEAHTSRGTEVAKASEVSFDRKCTTDPKTAPPVTCWNCGVNVLVPEGVQHSQTSENKDVVCDTKITQQGSKKELLDNISPKLVPCPSCGGETPENELNSHLDECLLPFTDDF
ncbi:DNA-dependent metalloprotease SPRTN-like isoform X4 [Portunus trituberculatus]|uniref:DNA-dependent metalloprotease SPRTN-like isoform X4 n=1 Tax=Portunus trituberculatus TaxID=210409 RepID=UPI001E1CCCD9|nr:DNA-dependent metalloprotease SPRTN-like isoform X4 [Portunus trituberculatus]